MPEKDHFSSAVALAPGDLDVLHTFLEAWCDENDVDIHDRAAAEVAAGLLDWYRFALNDRNLMKPLDSSMMEESAELRRLLRELKSIRA